MKKKIAIVGAFDRFNYGDLLFPLIIEKIFDGGETEYSYEYYGLRKSNLCAFGGRQTKPLRDLLGGTLPEGSVVLIAGGEVLGADWTTMYLCLTSLWITTLYKAFYKIFGKNLDYHLNHIIRSFFKFENLLPWLLSPYHFNSKVKIVYNTVGGVGLTNISQKLKNDIRKELSSASFLSVRDSTTYNALLDMGVNNLSLKPDSAILMSKFFPLPSLEKMVSSQVRNTVNKYSIGYLCFQINLNMGKGKEEIITIELERISSETGFGIVLLPIGRAALHDDDIILKRIQKRLKCPNYLALNATIYDIMYLIAKSQFFLGTSLHGIITAMSYCVPHAGLTNIYKLKAFLNDWAIPESKECISLNQIYSNYPKLLSVSKEELNRKRNELIDLTMQNFEHMKQAIE